MAKKKYDTSQPVLFIIQPGRKGRGYLVSALDDMGNPFPCSNAEEIGEAAIELLQDPEQARFDKSQFEGPEDDDADSDGDGGGDGGEEKDPYAKLDPAERLLFQGAEIIFGKARQMSNSYRKTGPSKKKKRRK